MTDYSGKALSVLGALDPDTLGVTLTHEHLHMTYEKAAVEVEPKWRHMQDKPFSLDTVGWIKQNPYSSNPNLTFTDVDAVIADIVMFKECGGKTLVENSIRGLNRDLTVVRDMALKTGVNIIAGTGYYLDSFLPPSVHSASVETLTNQIVKDIVEGFDDTGIKCGVIGEIGISWPMTASEKKVLQASAAAQSQLGCPLIIHPGRDHQSPFDIVRILQEAGADMNKTVMSHLDRTFFDLGELVEFAKLGCYCEYDLFGTETSSYQFNPEVDMPSDGERIQRIKHLVKEGFEDKVLLAHDIHTKHRLTKYGGHGYAHILVNVVPHMKRRGLSQEVIDKFLIHNPKAWLTFK